MDDTTLLPEVKESQDQGQKHLQSLYAVCQQLVDARAARGKRYDLARLLLLLVLAKLAGMKSLLGASEWIEHQQALLREGLHLPWKRMPCTNTSSYALAHLDSQQVNAQLAAWFVRQAREKRSAEETDGRAAQPSWHLAIDGKALKGTGEQMYGGDNPQQHLLHVYEVQTGIVLEQCPIGEKRNARQCPQTSPDRGVMSRAHSDDGCGPELSRVWSSGQACRRGRDCHRERQYAHHTG